MEVSSFELIYKPQSPVGAADTVLQGYFLNITNLEDVPLRFSLSFVTSSVSDPDRSLFNNTTAFIDTANSNNTAASLLGSLTSSSFTLSPTVVIAPNETAKIALLPSDPFPVAVTPANFEARGYVRLRLPPNFRFSFPGGLSVEPQLDRPARVLLTPQNRATYLDSTGVINDQTQSSLPTGSGAALAEIEPETGFFFNPGLIATQLKEIGEIDNFDFDERDLAMMLAALPASGVDFKDVNAVLKDAGIGMALESRKT
ncbi:hypothetical protein [Marivita sp.]|uniref:hypothetical protein n=1 Tax=Marivita sp. TaxID=2003365 RepID=UPI0025B8F364|nr:hypothetical protein [Marivita sp.]